MYQLFPTPEPITRFASALQSTAGRFSLVVGQTPFGDLFLRDPTSGEYAIMIAATLELMDSGEVEESGFREQILANPEVVRTLLRPDDVAVVAARIGYPGRGEAVFPVPLPAFGGSDALTTYQRGGLREYLGLVVQSIGGQAEQVAPPDCGGE